VVDDTDPGGDSDLRRRAVWLLVMLAAVAVLFVIVISAVAGSGSGSGGGNNNGEGNRPLDRQATATSGSSQSPTSPSHRRSSPRDRPSTHSTPPTTTVATTHRGAAKCPTRQACIIDGDIGNGIQAINDYRTKNGRPAVPGRVSRQAQTCAVHNGNGCSGGWAETMLAQPDGREAVHKILPFAHLLDPRMKSVEVGWAYDPHAKLYYFAIIRND
jgi:hypothetical protein